MEGSLFKWTNYVSGWQLRYFTLKDGTLSYYRSEEEVNSGCKGSIKLSVCDVIVHGSDPRRFDLILSEQRFYLRALSQADRQRWVVALGSCKVSTANRKYDETFPSESHTQLIATRQSELRLYHGLLVQQVKLLQNSLKGDPAANVKRIDEISNALNATCSTFLTTVDEMLSLCQAQPPGQRRPPRSSVDNFNLSSTSVSPIMDPLASVPQIDRKLYSIKRPVDFSLSLSPSLSRISTDVNVNPGFSDNLAQFSLSDSVLGAAGTPASSRKFNRNNRICKTFFSTMEFSFENLRPNINVNQEAADNSKLPGDYLSALDFAKACRALFRILDRLTHPLLNTTVVPTMENSNGACTSGQTPSFCALQQIRTDLLNNIDRLELAAHAYAKQQLGTTTESHVKSVSSSSTDDFIPQSVQQISIGSLIRKDLANGATDDSGSVCLAILWLARALNFVREFLHLLFILPPPSSAIDSFNQARGLSEEKPNIRLSDDSLSVVATEAYSRCLRSFHQWSVRGVAMIVVKSLPSRNQFIHILLMDNLMTDTSGHSVSVISEDVNVEPEQYAQLQEDSRQYSVALGRILAVIEGLMACLDLKRVFTGSETY
ncbi:FAPP-1 [Fasciola gigantica]|uniref:Pleckstrin homology domain-containing family A member 8 n=1 Tax=Fasciola gigantica TaxID=46835 RepID=A0A504YLZ1_FASGI|nr:FAPP-1 [Fasciola gigantica]